MGILEVGITNGGEKMALKKKKAEKPEVKETKAVETVVETTISGDISTQKPMKE